MNQATTAAASFKRLALFLYQGGHLNEGNIEHIARDINQVQNVLPSIKAEAVKTLNAIRLS